MVCLLICWQNIFYTKLTDLYILVGLNYKNDLIYTLDKITKNRSMQNFQYKRFIIKGGYITYLTNIIRHWKVFKIVKDLISLSSEYALMISVKSDIYLYHKRQSQYIISYYILITFICDILEMYSVLMHF